MSNNLKLVILVVVVVLLVLGGVIYYNRNGSVNVGDLLGSDDNASTTPVGGDTDDINGLLNSLDQEQSEDATLSATGDNDELNSAGAGSQLTSDFEQAYENDI